MLCFLGLPEAEQDRISDQMDNDNDSCLEPGLQYWLENHPAPSWEMIFEALYRMKQTEIMREVQQFVKGKENGSACITVFVRFLSAPITPYWKVLQS